MKKLALVLLVLLCVPVLHAQVYGNAYETSLNGSTQYPCGQMRGDPRGTPTDQIAASIHALVVGGRVDLTCYQEAISITSDIFSPVAKPVTLILPPTAVTVDADATIPANFCVLYPAGASLAAGFGFTLTDNSSCPGAATGPAPPRYSVQFNDPLGFFAGSDRFTTTSGGNVGIQNGGDFTISGVVNPGGNYTYGWGPRFELYGDGAGGYGQSGGLQIGVNDRLNPPEPFIAPAVITNIAITSNVLTVTSSSNTTIFHHDFVLFAGLTTATFLNGEVAYVIRSTANTLTCTFTHANYVSAADTGTASIQRSLDPIPFYMWSDIYQAGGNSIGLEIAMGSHVPFTSTAGGLVGIEIDNGGDGPSTARTRYGVSILDLHDYGFDTTSNRESAAFLAGTGYYSGGQIEPDPHDYMLKVYGAQESPRFYVYANGDTYTRGSVNLVGATTFGACTQTVGAGLWDCAAALAYGAAYGGPPQSETITVKVCTTGTNDSFDWSTKGVPSCAVPVLMTVGTSYPNQGDNIQITWAAITGHTVGDTGTIAVTVATAIWSSGSGAPAGTCAAGSLYTDTANTGGVTLSVCEAGAWAAK